MPRYINADKAKKAITGWEDNPTDEELELTIDNQPTADVAPVKHGKWINDIPTGLEKCSVCGKRSHSAHWSGENHYCGHCGARMDGDT